ncbi:MAG: hypothetical protein KKH98_16085 [Spirochaetes bacterium]|nr:hypothetical protein [Spirochaetota bacterium]
MMNIFKEIISAWRGNKFNVATQNDFNRMMSETKKMLNLVMLYVFKNKKTPDMEERLYQEDIFVNKFERKIRKRLVEHLAITHQVDIGMTLVMMSITKDAERIGDYCKNIFQCFNLLKGKFTPKNKYYKPLKEIGMKILPLNEKTTRAFKKFDGKIASDIIDDGYKLERKCDELVADITRSKLSANEAVVMAMTARFFKRIIAHMCNIASSIVYPVHKIDFFPKHRDSVHLKAKTGKKKAGC